MKVGMGQGRGRGYEWAGVGEVVLWGGDDGKNVLADVYVFRRQGLTLNIMSRQVIMS